MVSWVLPGNICHKIVNRSMDYEMIIFNISNLQVQTAALIHMLQKIWNMLHISQDMKAIYIVYFQWRFKDIHIIKVYCIIHGYRLFYTCACQNVKGLAYFLIVMLKNKCVCWQSALISLLSCASRCCLTFIFYKYLIEYWR